MPEQPHHTDLLTEKFFTTYYVERDMSYPKISEMLKKQGHNIHVGTLYKYAQRFGIGRTRSEARRGWDNRTLNYNESYMHDPIVGLLDGFLLGDGSIQLNERTRVGRAICGLEHYEFCNYLMMCFKDYDPLTRKINSKSMKQGYVWNGQTKSHPDFYDQYHRWYKLDESTNRYIKHIPEDVRITPTSVMLWYLGDGSVVNEVSNSIKLRLSTDGFEPDEVIFLADKLKDTGIPCHRNSDNRIYIEAKGIGPFFNLIGKKSPIKCYEYKFDLPEWRFESKRMRDVAKELQCDYNRLAHLVKIGEIGCYRASEKGRPRFLPSHIEEAQEMMKMGELY